MRRTRAALRRAIVDLTLERGFGAVTIDDLVERADITRATFYKHCPNKDELLADVATGFADDVIAAFDDHPPGTSRLVPLFEQARRSRDITRVILDGEGDGVAMRRFAGVVEQILHADLAAQRIGHRFAGVDDDLLVKLRTAQTLAAVSWFVEHPDVGAEEAAALVNRVIEEGWGPTRASADAADARVASDPAAVEATRGRAASR